MKSTVPIFGRNLRRSMCWMSAIDGCNLRSMEGYGLIIGPHDPADKKQLQFDLLVVVESVRLAGRMSAPDAASLPKLPATGFPMRLFPLAAVAHRIFATLEADGGLHTGSAEYVCLLADIHAFFMHVRSLVDDLAPLLATVALKPGQAPKDSFRALRDWVGKHPRRAGTTLSDALSGDLAWFDKAKEVRDALVHRDANALVFSAESGAPGINVLLGTRSLLGSRSDGGTAVPPLVPVVAAYVQAMFGFFDEVASATRVGVNPQNLYSVYLSGHVVEALHRLLDEDSPVQTW